jgi:hypothetical protein
MCTLEIKPEINPTVNDLMDLISEETFNRVHLQGLHRPILSPSCLHVEHQHRAKDQ